MNKEILDQEDTYSMILMLLCASSDNPQYTIINELAYLLDHDSFVNFIKYFEGQTIKIPTFKEIIDALNILLLFQYYKVEGKDWHESLKLVGIETDVKSSYSAKFKLDRFCARLNKYNYKLGGLLNDNKT